MPSRTSFSYPIQGLKLALLVPDSGVSQSCRQAGPQPAADFAVRLLSLQTRLPAPPLSEMIVVNVREWTYHLLHFPQKGPSPCHLQQLAICERFSARRVLSLTTLETPKSTVPFSLNSSPPSNTPLACSTLAPRAGPLSLRGLQTKGEQKRRKQC